MGTSFGKLLEPRRTQWTDLEGRDVAVDAFNSLYAFLSIIRQRDGTPLLDRQGRITSHLSGLFYRSIKLLEYGIRPVYVFDGKSPGLKRDEVARRKKIRTKAHKEWQKAKDEGRMEDARKAAQASSRLTSDMVEESKQLLTALGIPVLQAPSEGEALAAQMAREGLVWASASQDNDSLLYDCPRTIRNAVGRRRYRRGGEVQPELIDLQETLDRLEITRLQLIDIAIMIGTDYNDKIPGVGPKTALKLIKKHGDLETIEENTDRVLDFPYQEIRDIFLNPPTIEIEKPELSMQSPDEITRIMCKEHQFSQGRIMKGIERLATAHANIRDTSMQSSLTDFF